MKHEDYIQHDGLSLGELVRKGKITPEELLDAAITQMERIQPAINAVCWSELDLARDQAKQMHQTLQSNKETLKGQFLGVPMLLKDLGITAKGFILTNGSRLFKGDKSSQDNELALRLRKAGFNFFGRSKTPEFGANCTTEALFYGEPTRNPWNTALSSGGSSGGAAAAVAAGILPVAHASDGGGSIRIPASCCGLFGLKPTRMRNPTGPIAGEGWGSLGVEHVISRSVRDSAAVLDATHGRDIGAPYCAPIFTGRYQDLNKTELQPLRIGLVTKSPSGLPVHTDCLAAVEDAAKLCETLGHHIMPTELPDINYADFGHAMRLIVAASIAQAVRAGCAIHNTAPNLDLLEISIFTAIDFAKKHSAVDYTDAVALIHQIGRKLGFFMQNYDVLLTPTLTSPPVEIGRYAANRDYVTHRSDTLQFTAFLPYFNASGQPAMSVPLYWNRDNLPIGVQFAADAGREDVLFRLAFQLEQARPWFDKLSPLAF
ncbi:amidase [Xenorhabdus griffiniae]|uniref:amidase n=1 Tax=Xenorhabdus griffiniae TaxID=351672 RepID=UPI0023581869|nr:amidase [Xenorhabdus griffiniae]MDC9605338.1 amidase [Xenorhabdus griffiniae]